MIQVARAYTLTSDECQNLAQKILLKEWHSMPKFEAKASPATWFYRVALQTAMNWQQNDRPRRLHQQRLLEVQAFAFESADSADLMEQRELVEQLYQAIHQRPESDVAPVPLYLDGNCRFQSLRSRFTVSELAIPNVTCEGRRRWATSQLQ